MHAVDVGTGRESVATPLRWWYPACRASELGSKPVAITFMDRPLAVFRGPGGAPAAVLDRCAHRNAPLSLGRVHADGCIECPYHGWRYDGSGSCTNVPGLLGADAAPSPVRDVLAHPAMEKDGFIWIWGEAGGVPTRDPFPLPQLERVGRIGSVGTIVFPCDLDSTLHAALENTLDVPHTAFLHRGIFRGSVSKELKAIRRDLVDGCEVEFVGEPVGIGKLQGGPLAGKVFEHWDRFFLPGVAQVEYRVEGWLRIFNTVLHLPLSAHKTRAWFVLQWTSPLPASVVKPIVFARGKQVLAQDAGMLARQSENIAAFGGERFTSTDLDLLGSAIWRLLRREVRAEGALSASSADEDTLSPDGAVVTFRA